MCSIIVFQKGANYTEKGKKEALDENFFCIDIFDIVIYNKSVKKRHELFRGRYIFNRLVSLLQGGYFFTIIHNTMIITNRVKQIMYSK